MVFVAIISGSTILNTKTNQNRNFENVNFAKPNRLKVHTRKHIKLGEKLVCRQTKIWMQNWSVLQDENQSVVQEKAKTL